MRFNILNSWWRTTITKNYNGRSYQYIILPQNTYIYRGFIYGSNPYYDPENPRIKLKTDEPEYLENINNNEKQYNRLKNGFYYGNLGVACNYAYSLESHSGIYHILQEYITKKILYFLDMNNWQNLKNVIDTYIEDNNSNNSIQLLLEQCYGFDINNPSKTLSRDSGGMDSEMTKTMRKWLAQNNGLNIDGFGNTQIDEFHSEIVCVDKNNLKLEKEYKSDNNKEEFMTNINDKNDILPLENIFFLNNNKKIYIKNYIITPTRKKNETNLL